MVRTTRKNAHTLILALAFALPGVLTYLLRRPRLTALNDSLRVDYPPWCGLVMLVCALGLAVLVATGAGRRLLRLALSGLLVILLVPAGHLLFFQVTADSSGLTLRDTLTRVTFGWRELARVDSREGALLLTGAGDRRLRLLLSDLSPAQRGVLERTVARHVRESGALR